MLDIGKSVEYDAASGQQGCGSSRRLMPVA
jgi:hypothetical protein